MEFANKDPRLQEISIQAAKEGCQKGFEENWLKRIEDYNEEYILKQVREAKIIKQLSEIMIALTRSLDLLIKTTQQKIKNI